MSHEEKGLQNEFTVKIIDTRARNTIQSTSVFICVFGGANRFRCIFKQRCYAVAWFCRFLIYYDPCIGCNVCKRQRESTYRNGAA